DALFSDNSNNKSRASMVQSKDPFNIYGILNKKRKTMEIHRKETKMERIELVTINKLWGNTSYDYAFRSSLDRLDTHIIYLADEFLNRLSLEQQEDLERNVTIEEIKRACGIVTQNAKTVKDFHPISLIGSLYKIIAKILANRLSFIIPDLISDVQLAFVSNRQILDGPFILKGLLS
nr:RNA-directed DNA polymerase, eukaryota [Tanacetum cinerariifolium]